MNNPLSPGYFESAELRSFGFRSVGEGVQVARNCVVIGPENIAIGDHVRVDAFTAIVATGPVRIGSYVHIGGACHIAGRGGVTIADFAGLSQGVRIYSASDDYTGGAMTNPTVPEEYTEVTVAAVRLGRHVIVGSGSVVLPGRTLHDGAAVGALSLITSDVPAWTIAGGVPARPLRERKRDLLALEQEMLSRLQRAAA